MNLKETSWEVGRPARNLHNPDDDSGVGGDRGRPRERKTEMMGLSKLLSQKILLRKELKSKEEIHKASGLGKSYRKLSLLH